MNYRIVNLINAREKEDLDLRLQTKESSVKRMMLTESLKLSLSEFTMDYTKLDLSAS